jgi:hypothetical protein
VQEVNVAHLVADLQNGVVSPVKAAKHANDQLVAEAALTQLEELPELLLKVDEDRIDELGLHLWCKPLVKFKFLNDQVEIVKHGIFDVRRNL